MSVNTTTQQTRSSDSTTTADSNSDSDSDDLSTDTKLAHLRNYLLEVTQDGDEYIKGKFIADEVGLSPKEIGQLLLRLQDEDDTLEVEKWSYTSATTWRIGRTA